MIGKQISHYNVLEEISRGGMGVVYKAEDTKLQRLVALKFLPQSSSQNEEAKQRFINEARAASALDHPNICTLYEIGDAKDGQMYMAMAHYAGQTLKDKIAGGPLPVEEAVDIAIQTARGLTRAHEEDITHRDIKPANLIVTERGEVKIVDFGLAKLAAVTKFTKSGMTLGTVSFMSPEQAQGIAVDHRTDIWSLGVVLYEMLTGKQPFTGDYDQAVVYSLINEKHEPPSQIVHDLPRELETILDHALAKKAQDRYQTAEEMLADLEVVSQNLQAAKSGGKPARLKGRRRSPLQSKPLATLVSGLLILAVGLWFFFGRGKASDERDTVSLAVLPLKGFGEEVSEDWFRDSMTDALITDLTKIGRLRVISQNSTMRYKDSDKSIPTIAHELQVQYVIDASIVKVGEQVRLSAKLVSAPTNENIWAENFQRSFQNILNVQADFAQAIARQVNVKLTPTEQKVFEQIQEVNPDAYAAYLRGRYMIGWGQGQNNLKSFDEFKTAIRLAPDFAAAYAGLADAYASASSVGLLPPEEGFAQAKEAAFKALSLDPGSSEAYSALGYAELLHATNWQASESYLLKAIELNPSNRIALQWYAFYLTAQARHEEAISTIKKAQRLDPLSPLTNAIAGLLHYYARDYERAIEIYNQSLVTHPEFAPTFYFLSCAQVELQQYDEALQSIHRALEIAPQGLPFKPWLGKVLAHKGQHREAREVAKEIGDSREAALIYIALDEKDRAFEILDHWFEGQYSIPLFKVAPWFDPIRSDPRFKEILRRAGLED